MQRKLRAIVCELLFRCDYNAAPRATCREQKVSRYASRYNDVNCHKAILALDLVPDEASSKVWYDLMQSHFTRSG